jgi:uncharacterized membrane protein HdeD (DUF308 family)
VILIGLWAIIIGAVQLILAFQTRGSGSSKNLMIFNGLITLVLGVLVFSNPWDSTKVFVVIVGLVAVVSGSFLLYLAYKLKDND